MPNSRFCADNTPLLANRFFHTLIHTLKKDASLKSKNLLLYHISYVITKDNWNLFLLYKIITKK